LHCQNPFKQPRPPTTTAEAEQAQDASASPWAVDDLIACWRGQRHARLSRDGINGVRKFSPRSRAVRRHPAARIGRCLLGAFMRKSSPRESVASLGPSSGLKGLLIGTGVRRILPGGPFTAYPVAAALSRSAPISAPHRHGGELDADRLRRAVAWELPPGTVLRCGVS